MSGRSSGCAVGPGARCVVAVMALGLTIGACRSSSNESRGPARPSSSTSSPPKTSTPADASSGGTWSEIGWSESPLIQVAGGRGLAPDPANPTVLAYCVPGGVRVSRDGGSTWTAVAVRGVEQAARKAGFALRSLETKEEDVECRAAALDGAHSAAVFATFMGFPADDDSFPFYLLPFATADGGRSWQSVPPPAGRQAPFGGFAVSGGTVRALFYGPAGEGDCCAPGPSIVEVTSDGGRTWAAGTEACPSRGPCVTWGPEATGNCAKGQPHQSVRHSGDGGRSWSSPNWPAIVSTCSPASLVSLSDKEVLLVAGELYGFPGGVPVAGRLPDLFPVLRTRNAGETWEEVKLPPFPPSKKEAASAGFPGLTVLSDGRLLAFSPDGPVLLPRSAKSWCPVSGAPFSDDPSAPYFWYQAMGGRLWWVDPAEAQVRSVEQESLRCR